MGFCFLGVYGQDPVARSIRFEAQTEAEMNAIPANKLQEGSVCYRGDTDSLWRYNGTTWAEITGGGGASQLTDLTDVSLATATNGFALMGNGTTFASRALVEADISDLGSYLTDVVQDLTPTLGGNLDADGNQITNLLQSSMTNGLVNMQLYFRSSTAFEISLDGTVGNSLNYDYGSNEWRLGANRILTTADGVGGGIVASGISDIIDNTTSYTIPHGLGYTPDLSRITVERVGTTTLNLNDPVINADATNIYVDFYAVSTGYTGNGYQFAWKIFGSDNATPMTGSEIVTSIDTQLGGTDWQGGAGTIASDTTGLGSLAYKPISNLIVWDYSISTTPPTLGANEYGMQIKAPANIAVDETMDGSEHQQKLIYDDRTADVATITFSSLELGQEIIIYMNRSALPTFSGATMKVIVTGSETFQADTETVLYGIVNPDGEIDYTIKELTP